MSIGRLHVALLTTCVVLAVFELRRTSPRVQNAPSEPETVLAMLPAGATLILRVDVRALREKAVVLLPELRDASSTLGFGEECSFDPVSAVDELVVAIPSGTGNDLGVLAAGKFAASDVIGCARRVVERRGGEPAATRLGSFTALRDKKRPGGEVAARDNLTIVSGGEYFRALVDSADSHQPAKHEDPRDPLHAALRGRLPEPSIATGTVVLPPGWLDRWLETDAKASPLAAVRSMALRLRFESDLEVDALVGCADQPSCELLVPVLRQATAEALRSFLGASARAPTVELRQPFVSLRTTLSAAESVRALRAAARFPDAIP